MKPHEHEQIGDLFDELVDLEPAERERILAERDIPDVIREGVKGLLRHAAETGAFGESRLGELGRELVGVDESPEATRLGTLFDDVLEAEGHEREALLSSLNPHQRQAVDTVLAAIKARRAPQNARTIESDSSPPQKGSHRYVMKARVAEGGMGAIFRVWDRDLRRHLAMKVMLGGSSSSKSPSPSPARGPDWIRRFVEEAQITGQLDHPGIAPIHELALDEDGRVYFTMRLVRGMTLKEAIAKARREEDGWNRTRLIETMLRVCETMDFAHSRGVLHRDLKPSNVMVGQYGETYVMDWGLAKVAGTPTPFGKRTSLADSRTGSGHVETDRQAVETSIGDEAIHTMDGDVIGTPAYMPPEQAMGELERIDARSDVYAVGATLYQVLTGQTPYLQHGKRVTAHTILARVIDGPPQALQEIEPKLSRELVAICEKAMARKPEDRYQRMNEFADDLRAFLERRVVKAYRTGAFVEARKWVARNKRVAAAMVLATLGVVFGLSWTAWVQTQAKKEIVSANAVLDETNRNLDRSRLDLESRNETLSSARDLAQRRLADYVRMADVKRARGLIEETKTLWPRREETVEAMIDWLDRARDVVSRKDDHRLLLEALENDGSFDRNDEEWDFGGDFRRAWQHQVITDLIADLDRLAEPGGWLEDIESRLEVAQAITEATVDDEEDAWADAIDDIMGGDLYDGLELEPQIGLIPLEPDPQTGFWEFLVWETGEPPVRDSSTERWIIEGDTGVILVLLPAGTFRMGSSPQNGAPNYDPQSQDMETPTHDVRLDAFFISKYELTQAQRERVMGAWHGDGTTSETPSIEPAGTLTWDDAMELARRLALEIPTEAQWEYATRAGTTTPWFTGDDKTALAEYANLADDFARSNGAPPSFIFEAWDDGFVGRSPVGSFLPNPFGLHDVCGNVGEWCRDSFSFYPSQTEEGTGYRLPTQATSYMMRGASYLHSAPYARSAFRQHFPKESAVGHFGIRLASRILKP